MISKTCKSEEEKEKRRIPPKQRGTDFSRKRRWGVQVPGAPPPLHTIFCNSSKPGGCQEPHPLGRSVQRADPQRQGRSPLLCPFQRGCGCGAPPYSWGALAPPSLVPLRERLCLTSSSPPQAPGSLWAEGTDRSQGRPLTTTFPCAPVGPSLAVRHPQPRPGSWGTGGGVPFKEKPSGLPQLCRHF